MEWAGPIQPNFSNKRAVVLSTDAGVSTDMTMDSTDPIHPNNACDQRAHHEPANPFQFFSERRRLMRSSGAFTDVSSWCDDRGTNADQLARCRQLLAACPPNSSMNQGISTLQFRRFGSPFNST